MQLSNLKIIRRAAVLSRFNMSKTWLCDRIKDGLIPPPFSLGGRAVGWLEHEINAVLLAMAAGKGEDDLKALVQRLIDQREFDISHD